MTKKDEDHGVGGGTQDQDPEKQPLLTNEEQNRNGGGEEEEEEEQEFRLDTTEDRKAEGKCCPQVNRKLLLPKFYYFCFFSAWGSLLPYLALYFKQLMLTPSQVGVIMGLKPFVNFLATPVWGALVDKFHIHKFALIVSMIALITSTFALSLVPGPKQQPIILEKHCNRTDEMTEMMALDGEPEIDKMVLTDESEEFYFSKSGMPWPLDFVTSLEEDIYVKYKIDAQQTFTSLFLITLFGTLIASPALALVDTATIQMLGKESHRYGKQRLTGSLGWGLGAFIVGASLKTTHRCSISKNREVVDFIPAFYVFAILMSLGLVVSLKFNFNIIKKAGQTRSLSVGLVALKDPTYLMFLFTALYLGFLMAFIKTFLFWHLKDLGGTQLLFSVISAVNCVAEVSMYFLSEKLIKKIGQVRVLYLGLICYSIRLFYYAVIPNTWMVLAVELLPGITTAAVWAACLSYVSINSKPGAQTTMQCILHGVHWGLGYGAGEVIGGILVHHYGAPTTFVLFGILCIVVLLTYILINNIWGKKDQQSDETQTESKGSKPEEAQELLGEDETDQQKPEIKDDSPKEESPKEHTNIPTKTDTDSKQIVPNDEDSGGTPPKESPTNIQEELSSNKQDSPLYAEDKNKLSTELSMTDNETQRESPKLSKQKSQNSPSKNNVLNDNKDSIENKNFNLENQETERTDIDSDEKHKESDVQKEKSEISTSEEDNSSNTREK